MTRQDAAHGMRERNYELLTRKVRQYLFPAIMMKLALQLGNVVDTMLVGNILGTEAMTAVGMSLPVLNMVQIPAIFWGVGGSVYAGILLGRRQRQEAREVFTVSFFLTLAMDMIFCTASFFASEPLAGLLAGGSDLREDVASCIFIYLAGAPILCMGVCLSRFLSADSHPRLSSAYYIISNVLNLLFDVIFLKYARLGVKGSALSTVLGFGLGLVVMLFYVRSGKRMLSFAFGKPSAELLKSIASTGLPNLTYITVVMIRGFVMNGMIMAVLRENGVAIYTICNNMYLILKMFVGGIMESVPYIVGALYGDRDYGGIRAVVKKLFSYAIPAALVLMMLIFFFTKAFCLTFGVRSPELQELIIRVLRIYLLAIPFQLWNYFVMQYYGAVGKSGISSLVSCFGNGIALILVMMPCVMADQAFGGDGYTGFAGALILAEIITFLTFVLYKKLKRSGKGILLIPEKNDGICLDVSIRSQVTEAVALSAEIQEFCEKHGVDRSRANKIAVAAEEMAVNTAKYGGDVSGWIDVRLLILRDPDETGSQNGMLLRIRDNGVPFDPTTYEYDHLGIDYEAYGIELIKKMAREVTYVRALDLNHTTVIV